MFVHDRRSFLRSTILGAGAAFIVRPALAAPALCQRPVSGQKIYPVNPQCLAVPNGLVGYWPLAADTTDFHQGLTFDLSGHGNAGAMNNLTAASMAQGQVGTGLTFNGTSSFISVGNGSALNFTGPFTLYVWAFILSLPSATNFAELFDKEVGNNGYSFLVNSAGNPQLYIGNGTSFTGVTNTTTILGASWAFLAARYDGTLMSVLVNGKQDGSSFSSAAPGITSSQAMQIGRRSVGVPNDRYINAILCGGGACNRALDLWEVQLLYRAGLAGQRTPWPNYGNVEPINLNRRDIFRRIAA